MAEYEPIALFAAARHSPILLTAKNAKMHYGL
jgi:hypothetical protein